MSKILVVVDSSFQRKILGDLISSFGYNVTKTDSGESMLKMIKEETFDCICLDLLMPGISGVEVMEQLQEKRGIPPIQAA
jgi:CheY-like chemotaxis protein